MIDNVNILNILEVTPLDLSIWLSNSILSGVRIPVPNANQPLDINNDIMPLLPIIANHIMFITELYCCVMGSKPLATKSTSEDPLSTTNINAKIDMLYRTIQSLEAARNTAVSIKSTAQLKSQFSI
jgi:hypothetical protein